MSYQLAIVVFCLPVAMIAALVNLVPDDKHEPSKETKVLLRSLKTGNDWKDVSAYSDELRRSTDVLLHAKSGLCIDVSGLVYHCVPAKVEGYRPYLEGPIPEFTRDHKIIAHACVAYRETARKNRLGNALGILEKELK